MATFFSYINRRVNGFVHRTATDSFFFWLGLMRIRFFGGTGAFCNCVGGLAATGFWGSGSMGVGGISANAGTSASGMMSIVSFSILFLFLRAIKFSLYHLSDVVFL